MSASELKSQGPVRVPITWRNGSATFLLSLAGLMMANLAPLIIGVLEDLGYGIVDAGNILTASLLASAVVGLATASLAAGERRRVLALVGSIVASAGFVTAAVVGDKSIATISFIIGGAGVGAAISTSGAAIAAIQNPNRVSAASGVFNRLMVMLALAVIPILGVAQLTVFGALALLSLLGLVLSFWLPNLVDSNSFEPVSREPIDRKGWLAGLSLLILFAVWGASEDAVWALAGVLGGEVGLAEDHLGLALSAAAGGGAIAMVVITVIGSRIGRAVPLFLAICAGGVVKLGIGLVENPVLFAVLVVVVNTIYMFAFVLFIATAAGLDVHGRWSGPLIGAYLVGSSFAPSIGAQLIESFGTTIFMVTMAAVSFVVMVPVFIIARRSMVVEQRQAGQ